jgi:hypothetical protein
VTRQVGQLCRSVSSVAAEYGVGWDTAWAAIRIQGTPLVEDRGRVGMVRALGADEHSYLAANPAHPTVYATTLVDLDRRRIIDLFEGKSDPRTKGEQAAVGGDFVVAACGGGGHPHHRLVQGLAPIEP